VSAASFQSRFQVAIVFAASSLLFVPGSRPDRFAKAKAAGADLTVIDLEDAVAAGDKLEAREAALGQLVSGKGGWAIRMNGLMTAAGVRDLAAFTETETLPDTLLVPMVECASELDILVGALGDARPALVPLIETPRGLRRALEIASHPATAAVMFGGGDFSGELGVELAWEPLLAARHQIILACAEARKTAIDVPFIQLENEAGLAEECAKARALGFTAKAAIHPRQLPAIMAAFAPSESEVAEAREAIAAFEEAGGKAIRFKGRMLEAPFVKKYRAVIARHEEKLHA
jgi:citrate lyase subunit beta/citryl-CoA lyase/(S)-citramalyl-CoA lyase